MVILVVCTMQTPPRYLVGGVKRSSSALFHAWRMGAGSTMERAETADESCSGGSVHVAALQSRRKTTMQKLQRTLRADYTTNLRPMHYFFCDFLCWGFSRPFGFIMLCLL